MTGEPASILRRTATGAGWILGWRACARGLGVISTLVLVRLLVPADFGLVALATGFWQAIDALSSLGIEEAMIREKTPSRALYDTGFTINALRGVLTIVIVVSSAWPFAWFFDEPRLVPVLLSLTVVALANAIENIGIVDFRRNLDFRKEFVMFVFPRVVSTAGTIIAALIWRSYWALVVGILLSSVLRLIGGYLLHPYRPRLSLVAWRDIASFSFWSWALSLTTLLRDRVDNFVIGRMLGLTSVGIYAIGSEIAALPTTELVAPLGRACFSAFAAARNAGSDTAGTFLRLMSGAAMLGLPAAVGISVVAGPVVRLAFGDRWLTAIPLIEILGVTLTVTVFGTISAVLLTAYAALKPQFRVQVLAIMLRIAAMVGLVVPFGLPGAALGLSLSLAVEHSVYTGMALRCLGLGWTDLLRQVWRSGLATLFMVAVLAALGLAWRDVAAEGTALVWLLVVPIGIGAAVYTAVLLLLWLAAGRPSGAEQDAITVIRTAWFRAIG